MHGAAIRGEQYLCPPVNRRKRFQTGSSIEPANLALHQPTNLVNGESILRPTGKDDADALMLESIRHCRERGWFPELGRPTGHGVDDNQPVLLADTGSMQKRNCLGFMVGGNGKLVANASCRD